MIKKAALLIFLCLSLTVCKDPGVEQTSPAGHFDLLVVNGMVYDGLGGDPFRADLGVNGDRIVAIGNDLGNADQTIDANGLAVAPGFINMLSWSTETLIEDGLSQGEVRQGVTLEVMGEGWSMGPLNDEMKAMYLKRQGDIKFDIEWTTLGEYLQWLEDKGVSTNVASFVGATTLRILARN